jgi:hypothetical protein
MIRMMRNQKTSRARVCPRSDGSRKPGAPGGRSAGLPARAKADPAKPANKKGVLADHVDEIRRLAQAGMRQSNIARKVKVTSPAIRKLLGGGSYKRRGRWARRQTQCTYCRDNIPVNGASTKSICDSCALRMSSKVTVYDRDKGIGEVPENLRRRYSLSG